MMRRTTSAGPGPSSAEIKAALEALEVIEASAHRDVLTALTRFLAQQSAQLGVS